MIVDGWDLVLLPAGVEVCEKRVGLSGHGVSLVKKAIQ